ncbi:acetyltransferase [Microsporum canis CBS 113480]|uniref:Acetyltransferase n=1 Tax=Arthroderma otae (strain ATCC MYA-4605 / CBS 113480) TaxID=554155 RepID=C5FZZ5_ARTOC|nr:acetyltransferase [Microsporum canis CBS 113480]EEQ35448.1 acetyltransferase [Microsporum canis CBS 113480]
MHQVADATESCLGKPDMIPSRNGFSIRPARSERDVQATVSLIKAYSTSLGIDLTFQDFKTEMASFPGKYTPPDGEILLAIDDQTGEVLGCICLRPLVPKIFSPDNTGAPSQDSNSVNGGKRYCEMKRLYVLPSTRGRGIARERGYDEMKLDTLRHMRAPIELYRSLGFKDIDKYYETPLDDTVFLGLEL